MEFRRVLFRSWPPAHDSGHLHALAVADQLDRHPRPDRRIGHQIGKRVLGRHFLPVDLPDHVALANARAGGRLARLDARDDLAPVLLQPEAGRDVFRHRLDAYAPLAALHRSAAPVHFDDGLCLFGRDWTVDAHFDSLVLINDVVEADDIAPTN